MVFCICSELLELFYGTGSEESLIVLTAIQLEPSLIATFSTSMGQRGYNGVIDHLWGNQSKEWLTKLSVKEPELRGSTERTGLGVREGNV